jgi:phage-related protein
MAFWGWEFLIDNVSSVDFGLFISSIEGSSVINSPMGSGLNPIVKKLLRNPVEYLYGVELGPPLEFSLEFFSANPISSEDRNIIGQWLFGNMAYRKLQIIQYDLENVYFNVLITNATATYVGNQHYGWRCDIKCDSPFAYEYSNVTTRTGGAGILNETFNFNNLSATQDYTYPLLAFTTNGIGTSFSITNAMDTSRIFLFDSISANETITVDNQRQIITSSLGLMRISRFNKNWLRLLPGINALTSVGGVTSYTITYTPFKKIGG